eukprot:1512022-Amphidinium_carterae.1
MVLAFPTRGKQWNLLRPALPQRGAVTNASRPKQSLRPGGGPALVFWHRDDIYPAQETIEGCV